MGCRVNTPRRRARSRYTYPGFEGERLARSLHADVRGQIVDGEHHSSPLVSSAVGRPSATHSFFLSLDDQFRTLKFVAQACDVAVQMFDLPSRRIRLRSPTLRCESGAVRSTELFAPARQHRGINTLATQERAELTALLAAIGLSQKHALLARRELTARRDLDHLRVRTSIL